MSAVDDASIAATPGDRELKHEKKKKSKQRHSESETCPHPLQSGVAMPSTGSGEAAGASGEKGLPTGTTGKPSPYVSPIASPLVDGKPLEYSLKLIRKAVYVEKTIRNAKKLSPGLPISGIDTKCVKRGVQEVTKSLRKGQKGVVFFACDVFPIDIIAHLPILCEQGDIMYAYVGSKKTVGAACRSSRPASVLFVCKPTKNQADIMGQLPTTSDCSSAEGSTDISAREDASEGRKKKRKRDATGNGGGGEMAQDGGGSKKIKTNAANKVTVPQKENQNIESFEEYQRLYNKAVKAIRRCHPYF